MDTIQIGDWEFELRPAEPQQDLDWAYGLFKRLTKEFVEELAGEWPEHWQYEFFKKGFFNPDIKMILYNSKPIGFFGIFDEDKRVTVQRMYIDSEWQGTGLGTWIIEKALERAHAVQKPFETEVLTNNLSSIAFYIRKGFNIVGEDNYEWVKQHVIRHRETEQYVPRSQPLVRQKLEM